MLEINELIFQFEQAAQKYDNLRISGSAKQMNKQFDLMLKIVSKLYKLEKLDELKNNLFNGSEVVKYFAASMILPIFPDEAEAILTNIAVNSKGFYAFNAKIILSEWQKGNLKFEYYKK